MVSSSMIVRGWLGSMFLYSAGFKLVNYDRTGELARGYEILPDRVAYLAGFVLPWAELLAGISLISGKLYPVGPVLGASLGTSFTYGSFAVLRRGADVPCGCTGNTRDRVGLSTLARALLIASSSLATLGLRKDHYQPFSAPVTITLTVGSLLPPAVAAVRRQLLMQEREQHMRQQKEQIAELTRQLRAPAPTAVVTAK